MRGLSMFRWSTLAVVLLASSNFSQAAWLSGSSGSVYMPQTAGGPNGQADGYLSFAVYQIDSADWQTTFGVTASPLSGSITGAIGQYIYFYEVVNTIQPSNGNSDQSLTSLSLTNGQPIVGAGYISGTVFKDLVSNVGTPVGPGTGTSGSNNTGNYRLGNESDPPQIDNQYNVVPTGMVGNTAGTPDDFASGVSVPSAVNPNNFSSTVSFYTFSFATNNIGQNGYSSVVFMISSSSPSTQSGVLQGDSSHSATLGGISVPTFPTVTTTDTPEPATLAMIAIGLPLAGIRYVRRLRKAKTAA